MMARGGWLPTAILLVIMALPVKGQSGISAEQAAPFLGTWLVTMTEPPELKGSEQTVRVWNTNGVVAASIQVGKFPSRNATGIFKDGDMLVITVSHDARPPMLENGAPIWAVIALTRDGDTMKTAQLLERSATVKRGIGKRQGN